MLPSPADCSADNQTGCVTTPTYKSADTGAFAASDIKSGKTIAGVAGSLVNCTTDGGVGCVTTATYKAANMTNVTAANIKAGVTIAGQAGDYPSTTNPLAGNTVATDLPSLGASVAAGSYEWFKSDGTLVSGSIADAGTITPSASNQNFTASVYRQFTVNGDADLVAGNIKNAIDIFGVTGNAAVETHINCSGNAQTGCVTTGTYQSADLTNLTAGNVKNGVSIAGVTGGYPSATYLLSGQDSTTDLPAFASTTGGTTYEWFQANGTRLTSAVQANQTVTPSVGGTTLNTGLYRSVTVNGDADLVVGKIKSGVNLFGVVGAYPSATYPLTGADATADLDVATFDAKMKSATLFQWFKQDGTRYTNSGDTDIVAANIKNGVSIFGAAGELVASGDAIACISDGEVGCITTSQFKSTDTSAYSTWDIRFGKIVAGVTGSLAQYKNAALTSSFNRTSGTGSSSGVDSYDTQDDAATTFPTQVPAGWPAVATNWIMDPANDGVGGTLNGICDGTEGCVFLDRNTELMWAKVPASTYAWEAAITYCEGLTTGGYTDWRLPTQKELQQAYVSGIRNLKASNKLNIPSPADFWSSTSKSGSTGSAWTFDLNDGYSTYDTKTLTNEVICVRP